MLRTIHHFPDLAWLGPFSYSVRALGELRDDGRYVARLLFVPLRGGPALMTGVETTQSSSDALLHWARHLSAVYLDGALSRAVAAGGPWQRGGPPQAAAGNVQAPRGRRRRNVPAYPLSTWRQDTAGATSGHGPSSERHAQVVASRSSNGARSDASRTGGSPGPRSRRRGR